MRPILIIFITLISLNNFAQNETIVANEVLVFSASYNISGVLSEIAEIKMETSEVKSDKSTFLRLKCTATTYKKWDNFFKIRDLYESYVNPKTLTPYLYKKDISQGDHKKFLQYKYNHKSKLIKSLQREKNEKGETVDENKSIKVSKSTKDFISTLYSIRAMNLEEMSVGDQENFTVIFDNKETTVTVTYLENENISTNIGNKACYKLALSVKGSDLLKGDNTNLIWLTADVSKIPVYIKFNIPIGKGELNIVLETGQKTE